MSEDLLLDTARLYIEAGLSVHPCRGKIPKIPKWQETSLSKEQFEAVYKPGDNLGVVMGHKALMVCVDIDPRNGGMDWYHAFKDDLSGALIEHTGSGGLHLYFKYPLKDTDIPSKSGFAPGVDILSDGGKQVVTAPSMHECGGQYIIDDFRNLLDVYIEADYLPAWIIEILLSNNKSSSPLDCEIISPSIDPSNDSILMAIEYLKSFPAAIEGQSGDEQTFKAASSLWGFGLTKETAFRILKEHYNPKCIPSWDDFGLRQKIVNAYKYAKAPAGWLLPSAQFKIEESITEKKTSKSREFNLINIRDFRGRKFPPREHLIGPFVKQGLSMVYAPPGVGKTHFALGVAFAIASGGSFLKWKAEHKARVLYIDGELPAHVLQERIAPLVDALPVDQHIDFNFLTPDMQTEGMMPDISTPIDQGLLRSAVENADFIVVDNISCLVRTGKENEAESWIPVQNWALGLRRAGKSVLFVHHSGKGEGASPRGTSKREDVLDLIIGLGHPIGYEAEQGCVFEVKFRKARNFRNAEEVKSFQATYIHTEFAAPSWQWEGVEERNQDKIERLYKDGMSQKEIAETTGTTKGYVSRVVKTLGLRATGVPLGAKAYKDDF